MDVNSTTEKISVVQTEGDREVNRTMTFYNLDAVISVGYRVNSLRATQFRQWTTNIIRQFAIRGYIIDKKRMENGSFIGKDYFEHLLAEIREIRLSERRFYQKLTDIYATAIDYNVSAPTTKLFFQKVQNKIHYAVHGHTAAELIVERADSQKEHMGLTTWENAPHGKIVKPDVSVAKNFRGSCQKSPRLSGGSGRRGSNPRPSSLLMIFSASSAEIGLNRLKVFPSLSISSSNIDFGLTHTPRSPYMA